MTGVRILVTDDDAATRSLYRDVLGSRGYRVEEAATGEECLARVREDPPSLIILDLQMPVRDGFSTARALRAAAETASLPILGVTGVSRAAEIERALDAGVDALLNKPVAPRELLEGVGALLGEVEERRLQELAEGQRRWAAELIRRSYPDLRELRPAGDPAEETELRQWLQGAQVSTCSFCGDVRLRTGRWRPISADLRSFLERWTTLSHAICPACFAREYPGVPRRD